MPNLPKPSEGNEPVASERAEQTSEDMVQKLKNSVSERLEVLTELAAYDQKIGI